MTEELRPRAGVLPVDKAAGMTSHDVVGLVRRAFRPTKVKVGHAGTLDPDATGLLLVCVGSATRLADLLADQGKVYRAEFVLGVATSTEDASGEVTAEQDASQVSDQDVRTALVSLTGEIRQIPPMVSAVHHNGRRLYDLARRGIEVEREARTVKIERIDLGSFTSGARATGEITVSCGKGVYVRTLCADLGKLLGVGGHMASLRRLHIGKFDVQASLPKSEITLDAISDRLVSASEAVSFLPLRTIIDDEKVEILHGRPIPAGDSVSFSYDQKWIRLVDSAGELVALATLDESGESLNPKKVLANAL